MPKRGRSKEGLADMPEFSVDTVVPPERTKMEVPPTPDPGKTISKMNAIQRTFLDSSQGAVLVDKVCASSGRCVFFINGECTACVRGKQFL